MLCIYIISYTFLFSYARPRESRGSVACILCENCFCKRTYPCVHICLSLPSARVVHGLSLSFSLVSTCVCVWFVYCCLVRAPSRIVANYIYIIQLSLGVTLSSRSQLLNLNMQRGCHGTPRANTFNRGSILKSRALDRSRRFPYYNALLPFSFRADISVAVFVIWAQCRTMHDGWMSALSLELRAVPFHAWYTICVQHVLLMYIYFFPPDHSRFCYFFFFSFSLSFSLPKCIYIKKWIKAPNFLAYGRKWYAAYRIGVGRRAISTRAPQRILLSNRTKSYEKNEGTS